MSGSDELLDDRQEMWFSAMLRFAITIGDGPPRRWYRSVVLVRATDFDPALAAAAERGRAMEEDYLGSEGERVRWRLTRVETLDMLGADLRDGREVYGEPHPIPELEDDDGILDPTRNPPTQTGV